MQLRSYQRQALDALAAHRQEHPDETRLVISMATGLGKTITFAREAVDFLDSHDGAGQRVLVLVHTDELAQQAEAKVRLMARSSNDPVDYRVGVVKAERDEVDADIVIGSVQTLANRARRERIRDVGLIIVDECHHAIASTYQTILREFGALALSSNNEYHTGYDRTGVRQHVNQADCQARAGTAGAGPLQGTGASGEPERGAGTRHDRDLCPGDRRGGGGELQSLTPVTGYTATPERGDGAALGHVWQNVVFSRDISWAVRKGFLVPPVGYTVTVPQANVLDGMSMPGGVQITLGAVAAAPRGMASMGERELDAALVDGVAPAAVVASWLEQAERDAVRGLPLRSTVLFAPLVRSARAFADAFREFGVSAAVVHGAMPREERVLTLKRYAAGEIIVLCNAMVLTEGWDVPRTKCVIWARPTTSRPLFIQGAGRGLRPWLDGPIPREEQDCVLLVLSDSTPGLCSIADLSDRPLEPADGRSLLQLEDEFDLSTDLEPDAPNAYAGRLDVSAFDPLVARSSKVWNKTQEGALFLPVGKAEFITILPDAAGYAVAAVSTGRGRRLRRNVPDLELAMTLAEDEAQERGGDLGRLLADKTRPWRKDVPTEDTKQLARALGLGAELDRIMAQRAGGKAGRLSDSIAIVKASRLIDPAVRKLRERTTG